MSKLHTPVQSSIVAGHKTLSVVAHDEPERQRNRALSDLEAALPNPDDLARVGAEVTAIATTPDFHPGKPVPVGVVVDVRGAVLPHLVGNDIGCGMRMLVLDGVNLDDLQSTEIERHLRHVFFQGGRGVALAGRHRHAILRDGVPGLIDSMSEMPDGLLSKLDIASAWRDVERMSGQGSFPTKRVDPDFEDYADVTGGMRYDAMLGSIGGGNHFVEFGVVEKIADGDFARHAGLRKDSVVIVVHSGSLDFGQRVGSAARERLAASRGTGGDHRIDPLLSPSFDRYMNGHGNAANVAFVNRFLIGLAAVEALERATGKEISHQLVYDAPHNTVWRDGDVVRHRKGACPAEGVGQLTGSPYEWYGEPVILPGSMGDGTWLLKGCGATETLCSSAHGAGRKLSRQEARSVPAIAGNLRVVGPIDLNDPMVKSRDDIVKEALGRLKEEAPAAYRPIDVVIEPMIDAGMVGKVARIKPILTVKG
jgi:tRNA-splicing ligase RtcB (3'-phosphate/5'-hydroxy nucleic acid ligase)